MTDHLGAPQIITDDSGSVVWQAEYLPFGNVNISVADIENNLRFPGQYFDAETGLHYNWNRYYDPETGRYIAADPIVLGGGINLYRYANSNPANWYDFDGLIAGVDDAVVFGGGALLAAWLASPQGQQAASETGKALKNEWRKVCFNAKIAWVFFNALSQPIKMEETNEKCEGEECENSLDDYPANPDDWVPPEGWEETKTGEATGGKHRQWKGPNGELRRWDREGREGGKERGPHWHDHRDPGKHIDPTR